MRQLSAILLITAMVGLASSIVIQSKLKESSNNLSQLSVSVSYLQLSHSDLVTVRTDKLRDHGITV